MTKFDMGLFYFNHEYKDYKVMIMMNQDIIWIIIYPVWKVSPTTIKLDFLALS